MSYTIQIQNRDIAFSCDADMSVLDGALAADFEIPYSCRTGICGSCRGKIVSSNVSRGQGPGLSEEEHAVDQVLLCQARACSDVTIAVREVRKIDRSAIKTVKAKVYRMTRAAPDVTVLQLRFPAGAKGKFKAGQYLSLKMDDGTVRNFSMANPPHQNDGAELHIRHIPGGKFSQYLAGALAEATRSRCRSRTATSTCAKNSTSRSCCWQATPVSRQSSRSWKTLSSAS